MKSSRQIPPVVEKKTSQLTIDTPASSSQPPIYEGFSSSDFKNDELLCLNRLKKLCHDKHMKVSDQLIYRFAIFHGFNVKRKGNAILKKQNHPCLHMRLNGELFHYLKTTKVLLFHLPGLKSTKGSDVLYWRQSRLLPSANNYRLLVESMCYVLNDMSQTIDQC